MPACMLGMACTDAIFNRVIFAWVVPAEKKSRRCEVELRGAIRQTLSGVGARSKTRTKRYISGVGD